MLQNIKKRNEGFTIIEVMIVLAIAGLIMLIVFLAVPALQRNSRNTQYKSDASALLAAASEYTDNHNGTIPAASVSSTSPSDANSIVALTKVKSITNLTIVTKSTAGIKPTFDTATLDTGVKCGTISGDTVTPTASATRAMVMIYAVEDSGGNVVAQCTES